MRITNTVFKVHYRKLVIIVIHRCLRHSHSKCNIAVNAMTFWSSAFPYDAFPYDAFVYDAFVYDTFPYDAFPYDAFPYTMLSRILMLFAFSSFLLVKFDLLNV